MSDETGRPARIAIYAAPGPEDPLWTFGSALLGYDAATGRDIALPPDLPCDAETWRGWTEAPRHYGFHATLKAPFRLQDGVGLDDCIALAAAWAARQKPVWIPRLAVRALGAFVGLVPAEPSPALAALESSCVEDFEPLRAPLSPHERARRLKAPLTARQLWLLDRYGYPYVLDQFRFHMTLTGALPDERVEEVRAWAEARHAALPSGLTIDAAVLFAQEGPEDRFTIRQRFPFGG